MRSTVRRCSVPNSCSFHRGDRRVISVPMRRTTSLDSVAMDHAPEESVDDSDRFLAGYLLEVYRARHNGTVPPRAAV